MTVLRYVVTAGRVDGQVEFVERGSRARASFHDHAVESEGSRAGSALWSAMRAAQINPHAVNHLAIREHTEAQNLVATIVPVLEGAHVVWTVFYRADKGASCFRALGSRRLIPDALDLALSEVAGEIALPHKP